MSVRRSFFHATAPLLLAAVLGLGGCVWLRLLDLKGQFAQFDRYIAVPDGPGIELRFKQPPLLADDLATLILAKPTSVAVTNDGDVRVYAFCHIPSPLGPDPAGCAQQLMLMVGVRGGRVSFVALPEEIFRVVPRALALRALRAIGRADIDRGKRSATVAVDLAGITEVPPTREALVALLGQPNQQGLVEGRERDVWRFQLIGESLRDDKRPVVAAIAFTFLPGERPGEDRPARFAANISGMWLYLDLPAQPQPAAPVPPPAATPP